MPNDEQGRPILTTYTGIAFYPLEPKAEQLNILDIAHGLALTCRYAAQVPKFYSVAEHSVLVCNLLEKRFPGDKALHRWGLMHDASEAYLGDMPRPLKDVDEFYQELEAKLMLVIAKHFKLSPRLQPKEAHSADIDIFLKEREVIWGTVDWWNTAPAPQDVTMKIRSIPPRRAEKRFLATFERLFPEHVIIRPPSLVRRIWRKIHNSLRGKNE